MSKKQIDIYRTGIYLRLSQGDEDIDGLEKKESNSISNQKLLLEGFIDAHDDLKLVDIFIDDGYSGSNFDRPEFQRMMTSMKAGKLDCIIVKDLSRLARERIGADELNVNYDEAVAHDKEIVALKQELTKCSAFKASLYQDLRDEIISKEQFTRYREEFSAKERELEQAIREQETIIRDIYENGIAVAKDLEQFREGLVIGNLDRVALVSFIDRILIYDDFRVEIVFKYRQEMEKVAGLFDVAKEKNTEPVYTMVDGLPVLELKEAV